MRNRPQLQLSSHQRPGFLSAPPTSRPPTHGFDQESQVLCLGTQEQTLKLLKIHLGKFFSHVRLVTSVHDAHRILRESQTDLVVCEVENNAKSPALKAMEAHPEVPLILFGYSEGAQLDPKTISGNVCVASIASSVDMGPLHQAIRRSLALTHSLRVLVPMLPPTLGAGTAVYHSPLPSLTEEQRRYVVRIRSALADDLV